MYIIIILIVLLILYVNLNKLYKNDTKIYPKICWSYWDTKKLPSMIEKIKKNNKNKLKGWDVRFLNSDTISNYISKEEYPYGYNKLILAHQADWIRMYLLHKYGGCWMDASIILNSSTALDELYSKSVSTQSDITVFKASFHEKYRNFTHISGTELPLYIENWFIYAPKNSIILNLWFREFTKAVNIGLMEYKKEIIKEGTNVIILYNNEDDVYKTQHACLQYILQKKLVTLPNILILDALENMFKIQLNDCMTEKSKKKYYKEIPNLPASEKRRNMIVTCFEDKMNTDPSVKKIPYIKLTRHDRKRDISKFFDN